MVPWLHFTSSAKISSCGLVSTSAERDSTASLWLEARDTAGRTGLGESCPRPYVTCENLAGAAGFIGSQLGGVKAAVHELDSLREWLHGHARDIDRNPAAWCALELALLEQNDTVKALSQDHLKKRLAYSTVSQLGFMIAAVGMGAYVAGMFHLVTHAFFKAILFLGSGSVIHGMEHGAMHTGRSCDHPFRLSDW